MQADLQNKDTIAAIATPPGNGGVGVIRVSGGGVLEITHQLLAKTLTPRFAHFVSFNDREGAAIDTGIALFFPAPASYTGEDVLELQGHGGSVVLDMVLRRVIELGARMANPGEFTERAFLNGKLDLAQAEAVADLIESSTEHSARSAQRSLQGAFSDQIGQLVDELTYLRTYVEAAIDFVDEEIDFWSDGTVAQRITLLLERIEQIQNTAKQGRLLRDGMTVVLAGKPNAGKSSLLNALAGFDSAIVTDIAGTTRDILRERIQVDGLPLHLIDTAGLRDSDNPIEQEGIRRAHVELGKADLILLLIDACDDSADALRASLPSDIPVTEVINKIDLVNRQPEIRENGEGTKIYLSIKTGAGMELLRRHLKQTVGYQDSTGNVFSARRRHLDALTQAYTFIQSALEQLQYRAGELAAEDLKQAQQALAEITGQFTSDDLLGKIFSSFCIGK